MSEGPPRVFISYRRESSQHCFMVADLQKSLRENGVDAVMDHTSVAADGWNHFMREIPKYDYVILVSSPGYWSAALDTNDTKEGRGVAAEYRIIETMLYENKYRNE